MIYAQSATVYGWGSHQNARRIPRRSLTQAEREAIAAGAEVRVSDCPAYRGVTDRRIVCVKGNYFCRMPKETAP
jgi:hypothetical protein